jgi:signal transduction histidine kinase
MKIGHRLTLGFLAIGLLVVLGGYISVLSSQRSLQASIGESSSNLAAQIIDKIDRDIYKKVEEFKLYANTPFVRRNVSASNDEFASLEDPAAYIHKIESGWTGPEKGEAAQFADSLISNEISDDLRRILSFYEKSYGYRVIGEAFITNKYGAAIAMSGKTSDYKQDDEEWWQAARQDEIYVRDIQYDESADINSIDMGIRIDSDGKFAGVLKVILNIEEVSAIINEARAASQYKTTSIMLLGKDRRLFYCTEDDEGRCAVNPEILDTDKRRGHLIDIGESAPNKRLLAYSVSRGYRNYKGFGWILVVTHNVNEVFAPVVRLKNILLLTTSAMLFLTIIFAVPISSSVINDLERMVEERTKQLKETQKQLIKSERLAVLGKMAGMVSHEIRNPLGVIRNSIYYLNMKLGKRSAGQKIRQHIDIMEAEITSADKIISDILAFSRPPEPRFSKIDINTLLKDSMDTAGALHKGDPQNKGIEFSLDLEDNMPEAVADSGQIKQVFSNILTNAVQAMPEGGRIRSSSQYKEGFIEISISDTGVGISRRDLGQVFDPLFSTKPKGTGFGLSVCRKIIEGHKGEISITSREKSGATVSVKLPAPKQG